MPTKETTPIWAQTNPAAPAHKKGDPDWSKPETPSNGDDGKPAPAWAATVPTAPGDSADAEEHHEQADEAEEREEDAVVAGASEPPDAEPPVAEPAASTEPPVTEPPVTEPPATELPTPAPLTDPPRAVAADTMKSTWPPAAASSPAPPEETDIWPPEPPTERAMPAWPPPSEMEEPATPAQAIPSWPDAFEATPAAQASTPPPPATVPPTITPEAKPRLQVPPATIQPAAAAIPAAPASAPAPAAPAPPAPAAPARPSQPGPAARPAWAPGPAAEPSHAAKTPPVSAVQVPAWAPRVPLASEPGTPTWFSPKEEIPHATAQSIAQPIPVAPAEPATPVVGGQLPVAKTPVPQPAAQQPGQPPSQPAWKVVEQPRKSGPHAPAQVGPTAEDRSYAEWFAWAKRGGAPAAVCHAAAQGAFKALSSGKDVNTAVQWATAAMSQPPEPVSHTRGQYCAWFALANIDLNLDQHRAHLFAAAALQALDAGQDASAAHAAGLAAAGIR